MTWCWSDVKWKRNERKEEMSSCLVSSVKSTSGATFQEQWNYPQRCVLVCYDFKLTYLWLKWRCCFEITMKCQFSCVTQSCPTLCNPMPVSLSITNSQSLLKLMSIRSVMPSNHLILCRPLLLLPSIFPSIRVFSNKSVLPIRWPKY